MIEKDSLLQLWASILIHTCTHKYTDASGKKLKTLKDSFGLFPNITITGISKGFWKVILYRSLALQQGSCAEELTNLLQDSFHWHFIDIAWEGIVSYEQVTYTCCSV